MVPTVMEKHGKNIIIETSCNFSTAYLESRTRSSDNSISIGLLQ